MLLDYLKLGNLFFRNYYTHQLIIPSNLMTDMNNVFPSGQFHQHFTHAFLYESALSSFSLVMFWLWQKDFGKKALSYKKALIKC